MAIGMFSLMSQAYQDSSKVWDRFSLLFGVKQPDFCLWDQWDTWGAQGIQRHCVTAAVTPGGFYCKINTVSFKEIKDLGLYAGFL